MQEEMKKNQEAEAKQEAPKYKTPYLQALMEKRNKLEKEAKAEKK